MTHFLYKGIDVIFTEGADIIAPTEEDRLKVLEHFFEDNSLNDIKWVSKAEATGEGDEAFPMYHMTNANDDTLLFWPLLDEERSNLALIIEDLTERPDVQAELEKGYD